MTRTYLILLLILFASCNKKSLLKISEKDTKSVYEVQSPSDVDILAAELKDKILNSTSKLFITGSTFYVSNQGDDSNNGKTPDKAWATLSKVGNAALMSGDAVLFERGGTWRGSLVTKEGVTYSAFGMGSKPMIIGSLKNYSIRDNWILTGSPNVYAYNEVFNKDVGLIVFNNGEANSIKKALGIGGFKGLDGELVNDLEMYHNINDKKVYLYSANGNPADRFSSIEICVNDHIVKIMGHNTRIDNLCIKYGGAHGIRCLKDGGPGCLQCNGLIVKNCELGWIGGSLLRGTVRYGNAIEIYGTCSNFTVDHCYIYQVYDAGITHQYKNPTSTETKTMENIIYSNNLIENCIYSIEYFLDQPNSPEDIMRNIEIKGNICRLAGYGWGWQRSGKVARHIQGGWINSKRKYPSENFVISENIFDRSRDVLVSISALEESHLPKMTKNIYLQNLDGNFGMHGINYTFYYPFNLTIESILKEKGIEEDPTIVFIR